MAKDFKSLEEEEEMGDERREEREEPLRDDSQSLETLLAPESSPKRKRLRLPVFILLLVGMIGLGGYLSFSYFFKEGLGALSVYSTPAGARVYLNGEEKGETPINIGELAAEEYTLKLTLEGFEDYGEVIEILPNKHTEVKTTLIDIQPLRITSTPIKTAQDGKPVLIKASIADNLTVEEVRLFYRKVGSKEYESANMPLVGSAYQAPIPSSHLTPEGVEYYIQASDGTNVTYFPKDPSTPQLIEVAKEIVVAAKPKEVPPAKIVPGSKPARVSFGRLKITSRPEGAQVLLGGSKKGVTPLSISKIGVGSHKILLRLSGYQDWRSEAKVVADETTSVNVDLKPIPGGILITSTPSQADVYLDEAYKGKTPITLKELEAWKPYKLKLILKGYREWASKVFTNPGETAHIEVALEPTV